MKLHLFLTVFVIGIVEYASAKEVVCYVPNWLGVDLTKYIDKNSCTIFVIAFGAMDTSGGISKTNLNNLDAIKTSTNKVLISFGGSSDGSTFFGRVSATDASRKFFANNILTFIKARNLDGVDIDWEYPETNADRANYISLLQLIKDTLGSKYLVTVAISADVTKYSSIVSGMVKALDYIFVMTYDFHGSWDAGSQGINFNAPLKAGSGQWSIDYAINNYLKAGFPASKLLVGVPFYGNSYTLTGSGTTPGSPGSWVDVEYTYRSTCKNFQSWTVLFDQLAATSYMYKSRSWISMENSNSILAKASLANQYNLAGVFVWSIDQDDYDGQCSSCKWPLLKALNAAVGRGSACDGTSVSTTTSKPTSQGPTTKPPTTTAGTTTKPPPTTTAGPIKTCSAIGLFKHPTDCTKFYQCGTIGNKPYIMSCGTGTFWDDSVKTCGFKCV